MVEQAIRDPTPVLVQIPSIQQHVQRSNPETALGFCVYVRAMTEEYFEQFYGRFTRSGSLVQRRVPVLASKGQVTSPAY